MFFFLFVLGLSFLSVSDLEISLEKRGRHQLNLA